MKPAWRTLLLRLLPVPLGHRHYLRGSLCCPESPGDSEDWGSSLQALNGVCDPSTRELVFHSPHCGLLPRMPMAVSIPSGQKATTSSGEGSCLNRGLSTTPSSFLPNNPILKPK